MDHYQALHQAAFQFGKFDVDERLNDLAQLKAWYTRELGEINHKLDDVNHLEAGLQALKQQLDVIDEAAYQRVTRSLN